MSLTHLRAGVIGTGFIGPVHIEALKRLGIQVVAVCDTDANAQAAAARFGIPNPIGGFKYQQLVEHPEAVELHNRWAFRGRRSRAGEEPTRKAA